MLLAYKILWLHLIVAMLLEVVGGTGLKQQSLLQRIDVIEKVFHKRKKRFLIFDKGAAATFQGNIAKAIISGVPRGMNLLTEYTLTYDLPTNVEEVFKLFNGKTKTITRIPTTTTPPPVTTTPFSPHLPSTYSPVWYDWKNSIKRRKQQFWCPKQHIFEKYYNSYGKDGLQHCVEQYKYRNQRRKREWATNQTGEAHESNDTSLLFELIAKLAKLHGYNARYCIMRALCEMQHLLLPPGQLLFHDLLRILLSHAQPAMERHAPFRAAVHRDNVQECTQLYGLHCRHSFLQHFTELIAVHEVKARDTAPSGTR